MNVTINAGSFVDLTNQIKGDIAGAATDAMREAATAVKQQLRDQVTSAGLGNRLANTWRSETYPKAKRSVNPAGYVWSNAPDIIDSFVRGATIVPINGTRFLAIPTKNVPRSKGRRGSTKLMTPVEVQGEFNQELFFRPGRAGRVLAFVNAVAGRGGKGLRQGTKGRIAKGRVLKPVLMFVLVPSVRVPKLLTLDAPAERGVALFEQSFNRRLAAI